MQAKLSYAIKYVSDMERAVAFYRDTFSLTVRFTTSVWSEFETGDVTLALHPATADHPAGAVQIAFSAPNLPEIYAARAAAGLTFTEAPWEEHGRLLSRILDCEGAEVSLSVKP